MYQEVPKVRVRADQPRREYLLRSSHSPPSCKDNNKQAPHRSGRTWNQAAVWARCPVIPLRGGGGGGGGEKLIRMLQMEIDEEYTRELMLLLVI